MDDEFPVTCGEVEWDSDVDVYAVQCDMAATNFIKISKAPTSPLTLCEVEIYGEIGKQIEFYSLSPVLN